MTSSRSPARAAWAVPLVLCVPLLMGADGQGCDPVPGGTFGVGDGAAPPGPTDSGSPADAAAESCSPAPVCNLPDCRYGVLPQTDANGCPACGICAPPPDAGADAGCDCGPPPPVALCVGGGSPSVTCAADASGSCSWEVGSCSTDAGGGGCTSSAECASGQVCGFPEVGGCGVEGTCFPAPQVVCEAYSPGCACDGTEISIACTGLPSGYVSKPLLHTGICVDGG